ncbi:MAG TPA: DUF192 domain-containing protein [Modicisalibacter sp.]|nr:DUF192 domain-containing protein [Modicisalibacter sp.]
MSVLKISQMVRSTDGVVVCPRAHIATNWLARLKGLLGSDDLAPDEGLWLSPCSSIHTLGMRYAIDVVFLDRTLQVTAIVANLKPRRARFGPRGTHSALELPAGAAAWQGLAKGDRFQFVAIPHDNHTAETSHVH